MNAYLVALLCLAQSSLIYGAVMKKVPGLGFIYNSSIKQTRRTTTLAPGEFDPDLSIQRLMNAETRYHPLRIPEK
ncbi:hypothetical protein M8J77_004625 [Diaphorina citri]|nr:hypothetical protein M8J77_004625 [Diaphorina citri]